MGLLHKIRSCLSFKANQDNKTIKMSNRESKSGKYHLILTETCYNLSRYLNVLPLSSQSSERKSQTLTNTLQLKTHMWSSKDRYDSSMNSVTCIYCTFTKFKDSKATFKELHLIILWHLLAKTTNKQDTINKWTKHKQKHEIRSCIFIL